jgi:hypothetical protein
MGRNRNVLDWVYACRLHNVGWKVAGAVCTEEESLKASLELVINLFRTLQNDLFLTLKRMFVELNQFNSFVSNLQYQTISLAGSVLSASIKQSWA